MQSILQYQRIGKAVRKQVARDPEKANGANDGRDRPSQRPTSLADQVGEENAESNSDQSDSEPADNSEGELEGAANMRSVETRHSNIGHALEGIHVRDRSTREGKGELVHVVSWAGDNDPSNPRNFSVIKRVLVTLLISAVAFVVTAASSIDSAILPQAAAEFGVSHVTESLATGMFLVGFGAGTLVSGPLSEEHGRSPVYMGSLLIFMLITVGSALAPNIGAQITFRFLEGFFGCPALTMSGGTASDLWTPLEKTWAFPIFAIPGFGGPILGPVIGKFSTVDLKALQLTGASGSYIGTGNLPTWRWTEWITIIMAGLVLAICVLLMPETHPGIILKWRAKHLRAVTGDKRYRAEMEIIAMTFTHRMKIALSRPFVLVCNELIIVLMTLYLTVLYIVLFTFLDGYTYIFGDVYHTSQGLTSVLFVAMFVGIILPSIWVPFVYRWTLRDIAKEKAKGHPSGIRPETRLAYAMLGGSVAIPVSLFWMAWTDYSSISIWSPLLASVPFGYGVICIFMSAYMYIIDSYEVNAASALTFVALVRYLVAGGMTVVGIPFYENLGVHWTLTILGTISTLMVPIPYLLYVYGPMVRKVSRYAVNRE